jgi:hypothetical protein
MSLTDFSKATTDRYVRLPLAAAVASMCMVAACGDSASPGKDDKTSSVVDTSKLPTPGASTAGSIAPTQTGSPSGVAGSSPSPSGGLPPAPGAPRPTGTAGAGPVTPPPGTGNQPPPPPTTPPAMPPPPFNGPLDGDASKPMVDIPGLKCGPLAGGFGAAPQTVKITNRDVVIGYPCAHEGAAVTFFLFLHGTLDEPQKVSFTMNAFAIHKLIDSHNVVMAVPKAIGTQWGNGDMGQDLPHLYEVIDWVYSTFGTKFSIRSMWSQGGSWGAAYLAQFACDPKLQDRLKGIQLIVGGGCPACTTRLSCIVGQQELQLGNGMALAPDAREMAADKSNIARYAMMHGCDAKMGPTPVGNTQYWSWPNCDKGWVHSYYMAPGNHADAWDAAAVLKMTEEMKSTE